ncbi:MAG TPA: hypothetical protein PKD37_04940 [Oligoflexia bacterium]|nr:hypothetical protein [Oligoflexia bacterium]HMP27312.1 hypothetical protein [Oligoflexia bacterium]
MASFTPHLGSNWLLPRPYFPLGARAQGACAPSRRLVSGFTPDNLNWLLPSSYLIFSARRSCPAGLRPLSPLDQRLRPRLLESRAVLATGDGQKA